MRKLVVSLAALVVLTTSAVALAHNDFVPSFYPLTALLDSLVGGDNPAEIVVEATDTDAITIQYQFVSNLGSGATFGEEDTDLIPIGLEDSGGFISLEEYFDGPIQTGDWMPPLHPTGVGPEGTDITNATSDWVAYDESGLIDGPVLLTEQATVVWGAELPEPFDLECATSAWVGRTWFRTGIAGAPTEPFSPEELANTFGDTHDALAGDRSGLLQFGCFAGSEPRVDGRRTNDDGRIRPLTPTKTIALVRGNHVVFMTPIRLLDADFDQIYFATPPGGGPVETSSSDDIDLHVLQANPYHTYPHRVQLFIEEEFETPLDAFGGEPRIQTLLWTGEQPQVIPVGETCPQRTGEFWVTDVIKAAIDSGFVGFPGQGDPALQEDDQTNWTRPNSLKVVAVLGQLGYEFTVTHPDGQQEKITLLKQDGLWQADVTLPDGTPCSTKGTATLDGEAIGGGTAPPAAGGDEPTDPEDEPDTGTEGDSGVPWGPILIALGLLAIAIVVAINRTRTRSKDCEPERHAYAAAQDAYNKAKNTTDYWQEELRAAEKIHREAREDLPVEFPAPSRTEYPDGPEGDASYAAAVARHEADRAARADTGTVDGAREAADAARASFEEAQAAQAAAADVLEAARIALRECEKSGGADGGSAPPPPPPTGGQGKPDESETRECDPEGSTKVEPEPGLPSQQFEVPAGNVIMRSTMASWNRVMGGSGGITPAALDALGVGAIEDAAADFDLPGHRDIRVHPEVPVKTITVSCGRVWKCESGKWVKTTETKRLPDQAGPTSVKKFGFQGDSPSKQTIVNNVTAAKQELKALLVNQAEAAAFKCD